MVLMDVEMERMDGLTATREIMTLHPKAKILILTKYGTERMRKAARGTGARICVEGESIENSGHSAMNSRKLNIFS
jgi:DNA-binding NarL/FixJ family response regulator